MVCGSNPNHSCDRPTVEKYVVAVKSEDTQALVVVVVVVVVAQGLLTSRTSVNPDDALSLLLLGTPGKSGDTFSSLLSRTSVKSDITLSLLLPKPSLKTDDTLSLFAAQDISLTIRSHCLLPRTSV